MWLKSAIKPFDYFTGCYSRGMNHQKASIYPPVLFGILFLLYLQSYCQDYNTDISNISVRNGLSQNTIQDILEDDNGFLWVGTQDGLNKYDGYSFRVYKSVPQDPTSIPNNFIKCIKKDSDGNLWIGTQNGLAKYLYKKDIFKQIQVPSSEVNGILLEKDRLWAGTAGGLIRIDPGSKFNFSTIEGTADKFPVKCIESDRSGRIWIGKESGLFSYSPYADKLIEYNYFKGTDIASITNIDGRLWIASNRGLFSTDPESVSGSLSNTVFESSLKHYKIPGKTYEAVSVFKDHMNSIWVGTSTRGVFKVDEKKSQLLESNFRSDLFQYSSINKIYEDYTQCLWIGTVEAGLYKINISSKNFRLLRTQKNDPNGLTSNIVRGLLKLNHKLWIATSRGLNLYDRKANVNKRFVHIEDNINSISSNDVKVMDYDFNGAVWIGTDYGLNRLDTATGKIERYFSEDSSPIITNNRIRSLRTFKNGHTWIGTLGGGISVIDGKTRESVRNYTVENGGIGNNNVMNILQTRSKEVYATTYGKGLYRLDPQKDAFTNILPESGLPVLLTSIHESSDGMLWVGSYGDGFYKLDPDKMEFEQYTTADGLSNNVVYAAIPYKNSVWISTNYGLNKYDRSTNRFLGFNENDGIQSNEFNTNSFYRCYSGELFFGGVNGLTFFYPDSIEYNQLKPRPAFTGLKIFNETVNPGQVVIEGKPPLTEILCDSSRIILANYHNSFSIEFASLDYSNPEDSEYAYQLQGFDDDWIYTDASKRDVTYTNLNPGDYAFFMKASNGDGIWNDQPLSLYITIKPSIWQTLGFKISALFAGVSLLIFLVYQRINKVERRKRFLEIKIKEHTKEISEQNELLIQSEQHLINENKKKDQVFYILSHNVRAPLTTLVALLRNSNELSQSDFERFINDSSQQVSESLLLLDNAFYWSLIQFDKLSQHTETFDLATLVNENIQKLAKASAQHNITIFFADENLEVTSDRRMVSLIIQNLLFNSIKFSKSASEISVSAICQKNFLSVSIKYRGKRMSKVEINKIFDEVTDIHEIKSQSEKGVALGLIVSYKLANHLNCKLEIEQQDDHSTLLLEIPKDNPL